LKESDWNFLFATTLAMVMVFALSNCDVDPPTRPTPTPPPAPAPGPPSPPLAAQFAWDDAVGFTAFSATMGSEGEVRALWHRALANGFNTARVCAEVQTWGFTGYLPDGEPAESEENIENLRRWLKVTASIPGAQTLLMPVCTMKEDGTPLTNVTSWVRFVAKEAAKYPNVAIEVVNEVWKTDSSLRSTEIKIQLLREARASCPQCPLGMDDKFNRPSDVYPRKLRRFVDFPSAHLWRDPPNPGPRVFRRMVQNNGGLLVFSETVPFGDADDRARYPSISGRNPNHIADRNRVINLLKSCYSVPGCVLFLHGFRHLGYPDGASLPWFPKPELWR